MHQISKVINDYLSTPDKKHFTIHDKFAYLIKSLDGDEYYLYDYLPTEGYIPFELGEAVYCYLLEDSKTTYEHIFNWYTSYMGATNV